jgi:HEAT repeat protein
MGLFKPNIEIMKIKRDYKGLTEALSHRDTGVRLSAVEALGELGGVQAVEPLIQALNNRNTCQQATVALGRLGDTRAVVPLIEAFKKYTLTVEYHGIRCAIIEALGHLGDARAHSLLMLVLTNSDSHYVGTFFDKQELAEIQDKAAIALIQINKSYAIDVLETAKGNQSMLAMQTLRQNGDRQAVETLIQTLKFPDKTPKVAVETLGEIGDTRAVEPLIQILDDGSDLLRISAIEALGKIGDARAIQPLVQILDDGNDRLRISAIEALGKIGDARAIQPLVQILYSNNMDLCKKAIAVLEKLGWKPENNQVNAAYWVVKGEWDRCVQIDTEAVDPLIQALHDDDISRRIMAAEALAQIGDPRAIEPLITILEAGHMSVTKVLAEWLGKMGDVRVEKLLREQSCANHQIEYRRIAIEALGKIGNHDAIACLCNLLEDKDEGIRQSAIKALGRIGEPAVSFILASCEKVWNQEAPSTWQYTKRDIKPPYITALVRIGIPAIAPLCARLGSLSNYMYFVAIEALVKIGTPVIEPVFQVIKNGSQEARLGCLRVLEGIGGEQVIEPISAMLQDSSMREEAARALRKLGPVAIPGLIKNLEESYNWVCVKMLDDLNWMPEKSSAGAAYWFYKKQWAKCAEIGTPALKLLLSLLKTGNASERTDSAYVLGLIEDNAAVKPLLESLLRSDLDFASQNSIQFDTRKAVGNSLRRLRYSPSRDFLATESRLLLREIKSQREISAQSWHFGTSPSGKPEYKPLHEELTSLLIEIHGIPEYQASEIATEAEK